MAETPFRGDPPFEQGDQVAIQLHHVKVADFIEQREGQGALAGADFHQGVLVAGRHAAHQLVDHPGVGEKMLAEPFPGAVFAHGASPPVRCAASRVAASRLPP